MEMVGVTDGVADTLIVLDTTVAGEAHDDEDVNVQTIAEAPLIGAVSVLLLAPTGFR
jgi:hypothetical protein